jgi:hypothetical protein
LKSLNHASGNSRRDWGAAAKNTEKGLADWGDTAKNTKNDSAVGYDLEQIEN